MYKIWHFIVSALIILILGWFYLNILVIEKGISLHNTSIDINHVLTPTQKAIEYKKSASQLQGLKTDKLVIVILMGLTGIVNIILIIRHNKNAPLEDRFW